MTGAIAVMNQSMSMMNQSMSRMDATWQDVSGHQQVHANPIMMPFGMAVCGARPRWIKQCNKQPGIENLCIRCRLPRASNRIGQQVFCNQLNDGKHLLPAVTE